VPEEYTNFVPLIFEQYKLVVRAQMAIPNMGVFFHVLDLLSSSAQGQIAVSF
jgi:hypothetical protein